MVYVGMILAVAGLVGGIWTLVDAFKTNATQGILTLCIPFYVFYFLFAVSDNPQKMIQFGLIIIGVVGNIMVNIAGRA
jgi:hypothetical protein